MNDLEIFQLIKRGDYSEVESALKNGKISNINLSETGMQTTLLMTAVCLEFVDITKLLLEYGADPNLKDIYGKTALHLLPEIQPIDWTNVNNKIEIARLLIQFNANINILDNEGRSPLFYSTLYIKKQDDLKLLEFYLENGANPNLKSESSESSLEFAKRINSQIRIDLLEKFNH